MAEASLHTERILAAAEELLAARDLDAALRVFSVADLNGVAQNRCAAGRWLVHMLRGDFPAAWSVSQTIREVTATDPNCLWRGEEIAGKRVLVRCLHGFGDAVQFFRYAPLLSALAQTVAWEVPPDLLELVRCFEGVECVTTWNSDSCLSVEWDVQIEIMELSCIFRTRLADLPIATKYLHLPFATISSARAEMGLPTSPRVGLVWAAGDWNPSRSIPFELIGSIFEIDGCEFWNLQGGSARRAVRESEKCVKLRDSRQCDSGVLALAAVISQLDLVITVDTLAAHLAGALGVPTWVMLQYAADWRWMIGRSDSPWYPSVRLFRQPSPGNWSGVIEAIKAELERWIEMRIAA